MGVRIHVPFFERGAFRPLVVDMLSVGGEADFTHMDCDGDECFTRGPSGRRINSISLQDRWRSTAIRPEWSPDRDTGLVDHSYLVVILS